jgi:predicted nucleic acid-binding protein
VTVVLDTSVLVDNLRGNERARDLLHGFHGSGEPLAASVLTKVEVLAGAREAERLAVEALFSELEWLDVSNVIAERAGGLASAFLRSHPGIDVVDYVIAATAMELNATLVTRNLKHFPMFPGLADPYA